MSYFESKDEHAEPVYLKTWVLATAAVFFGLVAEVIALALVDDPNTRLTFSAAVFSLGISAYMIGNVYRLRDIRTRTGHQSRIDPNARPEDLLAKLPPLQTIQFRYRAARVGLFLAVACLVAATVGSQLSTSGAASELSSVISADIVIIVAGVAICLCGLWARPLD